MEYLSLNLPIEKTSFNDYLKLKIILSLFDISIICIQKVQI